jgi:hypothetical protein
MDAPHLLFVSGNNVRAVAEKVDHPRPILEQFPRQHNVTGSLPHRGFEFLCKRYETMALIAAPKYYTCGGANVTVTRSNRFIRHG